MAFWGMRVIWHLLSNRGLRVGRRQVARVLHLMQPQMVFLRDARRTRRAAYSVTKPMVNWLMDSWDKLYIFGFRVHAAIDGGTRFVMWAKLCKNQWKETLYAAYMEAVEKWGRPLRIRSDGATSHVLVQQDIQDYMGHAIPRPYIKGASTHNQRIELWWRYMRRSWGNFFKTVFEDLVAERWLDGSNPWHLQSLHTAFWAEMEADLA